MHLLPKPSKTVVKCSYSKAVYREGLWEPQEGSRTRFIGTTGTWQSEGYRNHRHPAERWLCEPHGYIRQRVIGITGTQQAESYGEP